MVAGPITSRPLEWDPPRPAISKVPYLPGLDGMRALAVVAVMVYHANSSWLPGGFIGVEVFFVISGYLITLLLIGEHERTGRIDLAQFWLRRARRLLPALFVMLAGLISYTALFDRDALGKLRGDVVAGLAYVSNWYQIWVGQGYTAKADWVPLRHLWSLGVEEQFYLVWPLVMVGLISLGRRRLPEISRWLVLGAVLVAVGVGVLYRSTPANTCDVNAAGYWQLGGRCINRNDFLYLSTITRSTGLLLGAAFAMLWRPVAVMRGPLRTKGAVLDGLAVVGLAGLGALAWRLHVTSADGRGDPWLYRGGFLAVGVATVVVMAAVTHRGAQAGPLLGNAALHWIGTRSYGLYLFHWPIYQIIRKVSGIGLTVGQFAVATAVTVVLTEASYRLVEMPVRQRRLGRWWEHLREEGDARYRQVVGATAVAATVLVGFGVASMATAELKQNAVQESLDRGGDVVATLPDADATVSSDPLAAPVPTAAVDPAVPTPTATTVPATAAPAPPVLQAFGDSVMRGAAPDLDDAGFVVYAEEGEQIYDVTPRVRALGDQGQLAATVVVGLGTNGPFLFDNLTSFVDTLTEVPAVYVLTIRPGQDVPYAEDNNAQIQALPATYPNVRIIDWAVESDACPGDCFYDDGLHLTPAGASYYTQMILDAIG